LVSSTEGHFASNSGVLWTLDRIKVAVENKRV
jgi:hypothetical protein